MKVLEDHACEGVKCRVCGKPWPCYDSECWFDPIVIVTMNGNREDEWECPEELFPAVALRIGFLFIDEYGRKWDANQGHKITEWTRYKGERDK